MIQEYNHYDGPDNFILSHQLKGDWRVKEME